MFKLVFISFVFCLFISPSFAYLGPGMGGGAIAATLGIIVAIIASIFGLIWFPLKRLIKRKKKNKVSKKSD